MQFVPDDVRDEPDSIWTLVETLDRGGKRQLRPRTWTRGPEGLTLTSEMAMAPSSTCAFI